MEQEWTDWHTKHESKITLIAGVDCWIWAAGASTGRRHGRVSLNRRGEYAHRAAYAAYHGAMPSDGIICHACGVGLCVRPGHLYLGTFASNGADMAIMGTGTGKLNPGQVTSLRADYMSGDRLDVIAARYGIAYGTVYPIVMGKSYCHVPMSPEMQQAIRSPRKLSLADIVEIRKLCAEKQMPQSKIAAMYGVAQSHISRIHAGVRHAL